MAKWTAGDIMIREVVTISEKATLEEAARKLLEKHVNCLVVEIDGWPEGLLGREDLLDKIVTEGAVMLDERVGNVMSDPGIIVPADLDVRVVKKFMVQAKKERSVVVEEGRLVGFISISDILGHGF
jgi:CBS domain-containing protein